MLEAAYIFPGQGAQYVGMGADFYKAYKSSRKIFDEANDVLGIDIKRLCFEGPAEELKDTANSQPAILTASIAALEALKESALIKNILPKMTAGLSLGEYSALVAAGALRFSDAVMLVRKRGEFMEDAARQNPGGMLSVIGLEKDAAEEIAKESGCEVANLNCPGQIVLSGKNEAIQKAARLAKDKGAKRVVTLEVSGAFHSSLMKPAAERLKEQLKNITIDKAGFAVVSNFTADIETESSVIKRNLINQVDHKTRWEDSIRLILSKCINTFFEIGPGTVLKGLLRKIDSSANVYSVGRVGDILNLKQSSE